MIVTPNMEEFAKKCIFLGRCHQKYFTLQFRPSPSEIVVVTRRTSPLKIQCIIPIRMWNVHNLTNPTLCLLNLLNLG